MCTLESSIVCSSLQRTRRQVHANLNGKCKLSQTASESLREANISSLKQPKDYRINSDLPAKSANCVLALPMLKENILWVQINVFWGQGILEQGIWGGYIKSFCGKRNQRGWLMELPLFLPSVWNLCQIKSIRMADLEEILCKYLLPWYCKFFNIFRLTSLRIMACSAKEKEKDKWFFFSNFLKWSVMLIARKCKLWQNGRHGWASSSTEKNCKRYRRV